MPNIVVPPLIESLLASEEPAQLRATLGLAGAPRTPAEAASQMGQSLIKGLRSMRETSDIAYFSTTSPVAKSFTVKTSTGYARLINPDSTLGAVMGAGLVDNTFTLTFGAGGGAHRAYGLMPVNSSGNFSGHVTYLDAGHLNLTAFFGALTFVTFLDLSSNNLTTFILDGFENLTYLSIFRNQLLDFIGSDEFAFQLQFLDLNENQLTAFSGGILPNLTYLNLSFNNLTDFSGAGLSALGELDLSANPLTTFSGSGMLNLTLLIMNETSLPTFSGGGMPSLTRVLAYGGLLSTVDMAYAILNYSSYSGGGSDFSNNNLDADALNALYASLGYNFGPIGLINVAGNPGTTGDDTSIAEYNRYAITGT